jgi:ribonuclease Z
LDTKGEAFMRNFVENKNIIMQSVGLFSSWCLHKPSRTLFDCGDGCALELGYKVFNPERIIFSHNHADHTGGFFSFLGIRNKTKGANDKPLDVYYPAKDTQLRSYIYFCLNHYGRTKYAIRVFPIHAGDEIKVGKTTYIKAFKTAHTNASLGYVVREISKKLKADVDPKSVKELVSSGVDRDTLTERRDTNLFAYTLDNCLFDTNEILDVQELVLDCTFLKDEDRKTLSHCTVLDCMNIIRDSRAKKTYLAHVSPRYNQQEIEVYEKIE